MNLQEQKLWFEGLIEELHVYKGRVNYEVVCKSTVDRVEMIFHLHTRTSHYSIRAVIREDESQSYLGCVMSDRETGKGRDFPDGCLTTRTWEKIMKAIVWNEMYMGIDKNVGEEDLCTWNR